MQLEPVPPKGGDPEWQRLYGKPLTVPKLTFDEVSGIPRLIAGSENYSLGTVDCIITLSGDPCIAITLGTADIGGEGVVTVTTATCDVGIKKFTIKHDDYALDINNAIQQALIDYLVKPGFWRLKVEL